MIPPVFCVVITLVLLPLVNTNDSNLVVLFIIGVPFAALFLFTFQVLGRQRILGGRDAALGEFPWVAAISMEGIYFCGGSLVSPYHILTAAHCVHGYKNFQVVMGAHNLHRTTEATRQTRNTTNAIIHEEYNSTSLKNDIALLRLTFPFFMTPWVRTIRLPTLLRKNNTFELRTATLTGWGLEHDDALDLSTILQKLDLKVISNEYCASLFPSDAIGKIQLCTNTTMDQSPCRGDSGGALTLLDDDGQRIQIGIDSFSMGTCAEGYPEVFSRVSSFMPWIQINTNYFVLY